MIRAGIEEQRYRKVERPKSKTASDGRTRALRALKVLEQSIEGLNPTTQTMAAFTRLKRFMEDSP